MVKTLAWFPRQPNGKAHISGTGILPAVLLAGIMLFDYRFLSGAIITPVCSFLILALLAFILSPTPMIFWACVYSLAAGVHDLFAPNIQARAARYSALIHKIRTAGVFLGACISVLLCMYRLKVIRKE